MSPCKSNYYIKLNHSKGLCKCGKPPRIGFKMCERCTKLCNAKTKIYQKKYAKELSVKQRARYIKNKEKITEEGYKKRLLWRLETLKEYGSFCNHCGEKNLLVLQIDHINGGGRQERINTSASSNIYLFLKRKGFPKDNYQLLCANCNWSKGINSIYPDGLPIEGELQCDVRRVTLIRKLLIPEKEKLEKKYLEGENVL